MQLCKVQLASGDIRVALLDDGHVRFLNLNRTPGIHSLSDVLYATDPAQLVRDLVDEKKHRLLLDEVDLLAPVDEQEVWAAGVTYRRSQEARERESAGAARFYDLVYSAPRPELFFKAPAYRVAAPAAGSTSAATASGTYRSPSLPWSFLLASTWSVSPSATT